MLVDLFNQMERNFRVRTVADVEKDNEKPFKTEADIYNEQNNHFEMDHQAMQITEDNERNKFSTKKPTFNICRLSDLKNVNKWDNPSSEFNLQ